MLSDSDALEESSEALQAENEHLKSVLATIENENDKSNHTSVIETKSGRCYSPAVRQLYYTLLSNQVPAKRYCVNCFRISCS